MLQRGEKTAEGKVSEIAQDATAVLRSLFCAKNCAALLLGFREQQSVASY